MKDAATYTRQLGYNVHALYSRAMNRRNFIRDTGGIIETQLNEAWKSGADEMMVLTEDMTPADHAYIKKLIDTEKRYLDGFADDIQNSSMEGAGWQQFQPRMGIWVNRIIDVENQARMYFGGKQKLEWQLGPTKEHCSSCTRLNGIVAWAEEWQTSDVRPQAPPNDHLECGGWECRCILSPTSKRRTYRALARITAVTAGVKV